MNLQTTEDIFKDANKHSIHCFISDELNIIANMDTITKKGIINIEIDPSDYKILIVDDVISNTLLLKALLKNEHYQIVTATNGLQAIEMVASEAPDLILLDVMMPGISGFEVSQRLKSIPEYNDIPIIFLTALNSSEDIVRGFQLGANDFITKPFNKDELIIRINHQVALISAKRIILQKTEELRNTILGRDKLYSVIAHDLRAPLGSIKMVLNMLLANIDTRNIGEDMFELLTMANQTTEDVFQLLDNLLKWTKSQIGRLNVASQHGNIIDVVEDGIDILESAAKLKEIEIRFTPTAENIGIYADSDMIKTVMRNLLNNALKFTNAGGTITVEVSEQDDFAVVSVADTGCGIKEEDKSKLLHADTHFSTFGTNNEEGSGLGLLLCQDFVLKNGGKMWFESTEGIGSTFSFSIPKNELQ